MGDSITIKAILDATGFTAGTKKLEGAVKGLGKAATSVGNTVKRSFGSMMGTMKRIVPMIIGVGSAYGIISRAVSAFMQENKALSSQMSSIWSSLGSLLGPIITQIISWISTAVSWFLQFLKLLGVASAGAVAGAANADNVKNNHVEKATVGSAEAPIAKNAGIIVGRVLAGTLNPKANTYNHENIYVNGEQAKPAEYKFEVTYDAEATNLPVEGGPVTVKVAGNVA